MPPEGQARRARGGSRVLEEACAAVALVVVTAAVTWVAAVRHYTAEAEAEAAAASEPATAAGAMAAAQYYFSLYGAGQYAAVYPLIAPADRAVIAESSWTGVHQACPASGLTYQVKTPVLSGTTAVMAVGYSGAASAIGSEQVTFTYSGGRWYYVPSDTSVYRGHDLAQAVAAAKAAGLCS